MNNYRPISIISVVANVFERNIYDQAFTYVTEHNSIFSHQSGFRRLQSTITALLEATDNWAFNIDSGNVNAVVLCRCDMSKMHVELNLNQDLVNVCEWLIVNKLTLNKSKTEFMLIGSGQRLNTFDNAATIGIDGAPIKPVPVSNCMGVHIDENLSWTVHIKTISKKIVSGIGRTFVPQKTVQFIFNSIIQLHF